MLHDSIKAVSELCFETFCRALLSILLMVLLAGMGISIAIAGYDLLAGSHHSNANLKLTSKQGLC